MRSIVKNGDISNKTAPIIAINFETIFNRKPTTMQRLKGIFGDSFKYKFNSEYRDLTLKLFDKFNIHIISTKEDISVYEDELFGKYLFFNQIEKISLNELYSNCIYLYKYYIDETHTTEFVENAISLEEFKEMY